jgi:hypothetical protein
MQLENKKIAILATNGFEQSELEVPRDKLKAAGATVDIISLQAGEIKGWDKKDWGRPVKVDKTLGRVSAADYDAIVLRTCCGWNRTRSPSSRTSSTRRKSSPQSVMPPGS